MGSGESMRVSSTRGDFGPDWLVGAQWLTKRSLLVDYILFIQADVDLEPNLNEVRDTRYVSADELKEMFKQTDLKFTPWFKLICDSMLFEWWSHLGSPSLDQYKGETQIRRM